MTLALFTPVLFVVALVLAQVLLVVAYLSFGDVGKKVMMGVGGAFYFFCFAVLFLAFASSFDWELLIHAVLAFVLGAVCKFNFDVLNKTFHGKE